jgi:hypothetical protein
MEGGRDSWKGSTVVVVYTVERYVAFSLVHYVKLLSRCMIVLMRCEILYSNIYSCCRVSVRAGNVKCDGTGVSSGLRPEDQAYSINAK